MEHTQVSQELGYQGVTLIVGIWIVKMFLAIFLKTIFNNFFSAVMEMLTFHIFKKEI